MKLNVAPSTDKVYHGSLKYIILGFKTTWEQDKPYFFIFLHCL
jgi:hypothetical protein